MAMYWKKQDLKGLKKARTFKQLAKVAIRVLRRMPQPIIQVCGPITTGGAGTVKGNIRIFQGVIKELQRSGKIVFNQISFEEPLWRIMKEFPRQWGKPNKKDLQLLEEFYGTIFRSGLLKELHFIEWWESSFGACWEHYEGGRLGLKIVFLEKKKKRKIK